MGDNQQARPAGARLRRIEDSLTLSLSLIFFLSLSLSVSLSPGSAASVKPPVAIGRLIAASRGGGG